MRKDVHDIISDLAENYRGDEKVLQDIYSDMYSIASNISNRPIEDKLLYPYVKKATKATYLIRGAEGSKSLSEGSISTSFEDIVDILRNDIIKNGLRRIK